MPTENAALDAEQQADADLEAGFDTSPPKTTEKAPEAEVKTDDGKPPEAEVKTEVKEEPKPEYVQLTKEERDQLLALRDRTLELGTKFDRVAGTFGNVQEAVKKLQSATPQGMTVELTDEDFKELEADYPGLAGQIRTVLQKSFGKLKGTAPAAVVETTTKAPEKSMADLVREARKEQELEALDDAHPEWRKMVGEYGDETKGNEYRQWLAKQPADYQTKINNTGSALVTARSIDMFLASKKKAAAIAAAQPNKPPDKKIAAQSDRIAGAVQPRGDGRPPPRRDTSEDEFEKAFNS